MKIGFFIDEYLPKLHGDITSTIALGKALEALGHTVFIVAPAEPGYKDQDPRVVRVPSFDPMVLRHKTRLVLLHPGLAKKLATYKFDVVHSQTQFGMGVLAHETAKVLGVPHISTMHSVFAETAYYNRLDAYIGLTIITSIYPIYFRSMPKYNWAPPKGVEGWARIKEQAWWLSAVYLNATDGAIAPSAHIAKTLKQHDLKANCHVITNGINMQNFQKLAIKSLPKDVPAKNNDFWIVFVGRISVEKRPKVLVETMQYIKNPRVKMLFVGSGPDEAAVRRLVAALKLEDRVYMLGRREPDIVPAILAQSDVFVLASYRFDNQPMVILEALAAGLPIIYCDDNLKEGLTKHNAVLTESPSPESLAKAMDTLAANPKKRKAMAEASKKLCADFDIGSVAKKVEEIYLEAIKRKKA